MGYSELFSLSREDVLAAMKDYPEAQDILQTLGRKRLQEAKNMSRQKVKGKGLFIHVGQFKIDYLIKYFVQYPKTFLFV